MIFMEFYDNIQGWMSKYEIEYMYNTCISKETYKYNTPQILEIGCWLGRTTVHLAQAGMVQVVDTFKGSNEDAHKEILKDKPEDWLYSEFIKNIQNKNLYDIKIFKGTSDEFFAQNKSKYKVILIDGSHEKETAKRDILNSINVIENNGYIFIDDINWSDVKEAVNEIGIKTFKVTDKLGYTIK